ncbi:MAG TPA: hypothetical protein VFL91_14365 [Thermomicrobiales bacterium]|nr:hypothetical protein [Thermomicrobiales bacterium]
MPFIIAVALLIALDLAALRWGVDSRVDERGREPRRHGLLR